MTKLKIMIMFILIFMVFSCSKDSNTQDIHKAVLAGDLTQVKRLMEKNPELITSSDSRGQTPLHHAILEGHEKIAKLLFANITDVNLKNARAQTPLFYAVYRGQKDMVELLLAKGAIFDQKDIRGHYPIHYAAREGHEKIVELLIRKGANINVESDEGKTPLILAVTRSRKGVVELLLANNAEFKPKDEERAHLLHCAARMGNKTLVDQLISKGLDILHSKDTKSYKLLFDAAVGGMKDLISTMILKGTKINVTDEYGSTPLHEAAAFGQSEVVKFLIAKGADIHFKRPDGSTPLHAAQEADQKSIADLLITKGAKSNPKQFPILKGEYLDQPTPDLIPEMFAPGIVSTNKSEINSVFSPQGDEFYFSVFDPAMEEYRIWCIKRVNNLWTEPKVTPFCSKYDGADMCISPDGNKFLFCSHRPFPGNDKQTDDWFIWFMKRTKKGWGKPQPLYCSEKTGLQALYPTLTYDSILYFQADYKGSINGSSDVWRSKFVNGSYSTPENLGITINSKYDECDILIAPDESYIIVSCAGRPENIGKQDLYISFRKNDRSWTTIKHMGKSINSEGTEFCPMISPDGKFFFFSRGIGDNSDVYWVDAKIIEELKPEELK